MPLYTRILTDHSAGKLYSDILKWLIENDFYNSWEEKITIKEDRSGF